MKELSIKQKAERYDELLVKLQKAKVDNEICDERYCCVIDDIVPELKESESEDEKIRKSLLEYLHTLPNHYSHSGVCAPEWIAWVEKQGENSLSHLFTLEDVFAIQCAMAYAKFQDRELDVALKKLHDKVYDAYHDSENHHIESQDGLKGEQKPTDKVDPKFKIGDWITNGDYTWKIVEVKPLYILKSQDGNIAGDTISYVDNHFHLWTIADAKDGDVLVASDDSIFLFAGVVDCACKYYVALTACNDVKINKEVDGGYWETSRAVHPATKEQRDLFFQKMKETGYEWDAKKMELSKIEEKSQRMVSAEAKEAMYDKPAEWSEKDIKMINTLINTVKISRSSCEEDDDIKDRYDDELNWLKTLRDRVQPKQDWSEEDEKKLETILYYIKASDYNGKRLSYSEFELTDWLKSIKERYTWKPSDEQMTALRRMKAAIAGEGEIYVPLNLLYEDLKKLKE